MDTHSPGNEAETKNDRVLTMQITDIITDLLSAGSIRGAVTVAPTDEHPNGCRLIIQGATQDNATHWDAFGLPVMVWVYEKPIDPATASQVAQRARVTAAAYAVKACALTALQIVASAARTLNITAQQAAMRYALKHPDLRGVPWDQFASIWDAGETKWTPPSGEPWDAGLSWYDDGAAAWT